MISYINLGFSVGTALQQELSHWNVAPSGSLKEGCSPKLTRKSVKSISAMGSVRSLHISSIINCISIGHQHICKRVKKKENVKPACRFDKLMLVATGSSVTARCTSLQLLAPCRVFDLGNYTSIANLNTFIRLQSSK
jgi:hypothetical protein